MDTLNALTTWLTDVLLVPFRSHASTGLVVWSAATGIAMAYVFGKTSNQRALRRTADNIRAQLLGVKLFKDDLRVTFQCQLALLKSTGVRLLLSIPPMLVMLIPLVLIMTQLAVRYEHRPLVAGEQVVVSLRVKPDRWKEVRDVQLAPGDGFDVETEALRDERNATIYWRVRAKSAQSQAITWSLGGQTVQKDVPMATVRETLVRANRTRPGQSFWDRVLFPAEPSLSAELPIESIELQLPRRSTPILGWDFPWWGTFFLVSMATAFATGKAIGVQY